MACALKAQCWEVVGVQAQRGSGVGLQALCRVVVKVQVQRARGGRLQAQ